MYLLLTLLTLGLLIWALQLWRKAHTLTTALIAPIAAGLLYDNLVLTLGALLAAGSLLLGLNWPRYVFEALVTPLFIPIFADLVRRSGATWLDKRPARLLVAAVTFALMIYGLVGLIGLTLLPVVSFGAVRYVPTASGAHVVSLATTLIGLVAGALIWRDWGWPWLALVAIVMIVASGVVAVLLSAMVGLAMNASEMVLIAATLGCERYLRSTSSDISRGHRPVYSAHPL